MKTTIPNKHQSFDKVCRVIESCTTVKQISSCDALINNFSAMFSDFTYDLRLIDLVYDKLKEVFNNQCEASRK